MKVDHDSEVAKAVLVGTHRALLYQVCGATRFRSWAGGEGATPFGCPISQVKKKLQSGATLRKSSRGGGLGGGSYRCVSPAELVTPGLPSLLQPAHLEELQRERICVVDDALPVSSLLP